MGRGEGRQVSQLASPSVGFTSSKSGTVLTLCDLRKISWAPTAAGPWLTPCSLSQPFFTDECKFKEILLPNNYNAYESYAYPGMFMALSKNGRTKKGNRVSPTMKVTHFLPRL